MKKENLFYDATDLYCTIYYTPRPEKMDYKFIITLGAANWRAFKTVDGFKQFMKVYGLQVDPTKTTIQDCYYTTDCIMHIRFKHSKFNEYIFWKISDIPNFNKCKSFIGLSNGSYVTCYYKKLKKGNIVYRPNSNAKEVYTPLSLDEHIAHSKILG